MIIGITGGSGSGKTTLTNNICARYKDKISVLYHDNYYKAHDDITFEERTKLNYDHPDAFETELLVEHLKLLIAGQSVKCPMYDYSVFTRKSETILIEPSRIIIVEGIMIFNDPELFEFLDIKIFVDTDADERLIRRILRDVTERGYDVATVTEQYLRMVKPMHEQFVEPNKRKADIIVNGGQNLVAIDLIMERINS